MTGIQIGDVVKGYFDGVNGQIKELRTEIRLLRWELKQCKVM